MSLWVLLFYLFVCLLLGLESAFSGRSGLPESCPKTQVSPEFIHTSLLWPLEGRKGAPDRGVIVFYYILPITSFEHVGSTNITWDHPKKRIFPLRELERGCLSD